MYHDVVNFLVFSVGTIGYLGIFFLMFLESSFFPFPSEVVMIPAGYLAYQGGMNIFLVILIGILGSVVGAWFNYFLAHRYGRKLILKFLKEKKLRKIENFFEKHGHISTFNGRLIPVLRQYISFPAGLAKMNFSKFTVYTAFGAGIWVAILSLLGYFLGENEKYVNKYLKEFTFLAVFFVFILSVIYFYYYKKKKLEL